MQHWFLSHPLCWSSKPNQQKLSLSKHINTVKGVCKKESLIFSKWYERWIAVLTWEDLLPSWNRNHDCRITFNCLAIKLIYEATGISLLHAQNLTNASCVHFSAKENRFTVSCAKFMTIPAPLFFQHLSYGVKQVWQSALLLIYWRLQMRLS